MFVYTEMRKNDDHNGMPGRMNWQYPVD